MATLRPGDWSILIAAAAAYEGYLIVTGSPPLFPDPINYFLRQIFKPPGTAPGDGNGGGGGGVGNDSFGVKKLYQTKTGGETWSMNTTNLLNDTHVLPANINAVQMNTDGSVKLTFPVDSDNRLNIVTSGGYNHAACELDWNKLITRGYMQNPQDWRNVEMTAYVRINSLHIPAPTGALIFYCRGGHHSENYICEGAAYKGNIMFDGYSRFQKEMGHGGAIVNTYFPTTKNTTALTGALLGKWFGYKFCCYDMANGDVKLENYLDTANNNTWLKVRETIDNGIWGTNPANCGGVAGQKFAWGGPQAVFRFDGVQDIDFAKMSIREIKP